MKPWIYTASILVVSILANLLIPLVGQTVAYGSDPSAQASVYHGLVWTTATVLYICLIAWLYVFAKSDEDTAPVADVLVRISVVCLLLTWAMYIVSLGVQRHVAPGAKYPDIHISSIVSLYGFIIELVIIWFLFAPRDTGSSWSISQSILHVRRALGWITPDVSSDSISIVAPCSDLKVLKLAQTLHKNVVGQDAINELQKLTKTHVSYDTILHSLSALLHRKSSQLGVYGGPMGIVRLELMLYRAMAHSCTAPSTAHISGLLPEAVKGSMIKLYKRRKYGRVPITALSSARDIMHMNHLVVHQLIGDAELSVVERSECLKRVMSAFDVERKYVGVCLYMHTQKLDVIEFMTRIGTKLKETATLELLMRSAEVVLSGIDMESGVRRMHLTTIVSILYGFNIFDSTPSNDGVQTDSDDGAQTDSDDVLSVAGAQTDAAALGGAGAQTDAAALGGAGAQTDAAALGGAAALCTPDCQTFLDRIEKAATDAITKIQGMGDDYVAKSQQKTGDLLQQLSKLKSQVDDAANDFKATTDSVGSKLPELRQLLANAGTMVNDARQSLAQVKVASDSAIQEVGQKAQDIIAYHINGFDAAIASKALKALEMLDTSATTHQSALHAAELKALETLGTSAATYQTALEAAARRAIDIAETWKAAEDKASASLEQAQKVFDNAHSQLDTAIKAAKSNMEESATRVEQTVRDAHDLLKKMNETSDQHITYMNTAQAMMDDAVSKSQQAAADAVAAQDAVKRAITESNNIVDAATRLLTQAKDMHASILGQLTDMDKKLIDTRDIQKKIEQAWQNVQDAESNVQKSFQQAAQIVRAAQIGLKLAMIRASKLKKRVVYAIQKRDNVIKRLTKVLAEQKQAQAIHREVVARSVAMQTSDEDVPDILYPPTTPTTGEPDFDLPEWLTKWLLDQPDICKDEQIDALRDMMKQKGEASVKINAIRDLLQLFCRGVILRRDLLPRLVAWVLRQPMGECDQTTLVDSVVQTEAVQAEKKDMVDSAVQAEKKDMVDSAVQAEKKDMVDSAVQAEKKDMVDSAVQAEKKDMVDSAVQAEVVQADKKDVVDSAVQAEVVQAEKKDMVDSVVAPGSMLKYIVPPDVLQWLKDPQAEHVSALNATVERVVVDEGWKNALLDAVYIICNTPLRRPVLDPTWSSVSVRLVAWLTQQDAGAAKMFRSWLDDNPHWRSLTPVANIDSIVPSNILELVVNAFHIVCLLSSTSQSSATATLKSLLSTGNVCDQKLSWVQEFDSKYRSAVMDVVNLYCENVGRMSVPALNTIVAWILSESCDVGKLRDSCPILTSQDVTRIKAAVHGTCGQAFVFQDWFSRADRCKDVELKKLETNLVDAGATPEHVLGTLQIARLICDQPDMYNTWTAAAESIKQRVEQQTVSGARWNSFSRMVDDWLKMPNRCEPVNVATIHTHIQNLRDCSDKTKNALYKVIASVCKYDVRPSPAHAAVMMVVNDMCTAKKEVRDVFVEVNNAFKEDVNRVCDVAVSELRPNTPSTVPLNVIAGVSAQEPPASAHMNSVDVSVLPKIDLTQELHQADASLAALNIVDDHVTRPPEDAEQKIKRDELNAKTWQLFWQTVRLTALNPQLNTVVAKLRKVDLNAMAQSTNSISPHISAALELRIGQIIERELKQDITLDRDQFIVPPHPSHVTEPSCANAIRQYVRLMECLLTNEVIIKFTALDKQTFEKILSHSPNIIEVQYRAGSEVKVLQNTNLKWLLLQIMYVPVPSAWSDQIEGMSIVRDIIDTHITTNVKRDSKMYTDLLNDKTSGHSRVFVRNFVLALKQMLGVGDEASLALAPVCNYLTETVHVLGAVARTTFYMGKSVLGDVLNKALAQQSTSIVTYVKFRNSNHRDWNKIFDPYIDTEAKRLRMRFYDKRQQMYTKCPDGTWRLGDGECGLDTLSKLPYTHTYLFGPYTKIYRSSTHNQDVAKDMSCLVNQIVSGKPVFVSGYGTSGAGKTSTLIYFNKERQDGVLTHLCKLVNKAGAFPTVQLRIVECFQESGKDEQTRVVPSSTEKILLSWDSNVDNYAVTSYTHSNFHQHRVAQLLGEESRRQQVMTGWSLGRAMIHLIDVDRYVMATVNNPNSSRSHAMAFIEFGGKADGIHPGTLIVGDFAGVENQYQCNDRELRERFLNVNMDGGDGSKFYSRMPPRINTNDVKLEPACLEHVSSQALLFDFSRSPFGLVSAEKAGSVAVTELQKSLRRLSKMYQPSLDVARLAPPELATHFWTRIAPLIYGDRDDNVVVSENDNVIVRLNRTLGDMTYLETQQARVPFASDGETLIHTSIANHLSESLHSESPDEASVLYKVMLPLLIQKHGTKVVGTYTSDRKQVTVKDVGAMLTNLPKIYHYEHSVAVHKQATALLDMYIKDMNTYLGDKKRAGYNTDAVQPTSTIIKFMHYPLVQRKEDREPLKYIFENNGQQIQKVIGYTKEYLSVKKFKAAPANIFLVEKVGNESKDALHISKLKFAFGYYQGGDVSHIKSTWGRDGGYKKFIALLEDASTSVSLTMPGTDRPVDVDLNMDKIAQLMRDVLHNQLLPFFGFSSDPTPTTFVSEYMKRVADMGTAAFYDHVNNVASAIKDVIVWLCALLQETQCRLGYAGAICTYRDTEAAFINKSLTDLRYMISYMLRIKNEDKISIVPPFLGPCLQQYCAGIECFNVPEVAADKVMRGLIPRVLMSELGFSDPTQLSALVVCVFCVVNMTKGDNNPPPVSYLDINDLKMHFRQENTDAFRHAFNRINRRFNEDDLKQHCVDILMNPAFREIKAWAEGDNLNTQHYTLADQVLQRRTIELIRMVDNHNAASPIGTIEFVDRIAKYNTVDCTCVVDDATHAADINIEVLPIDGAKA